MILLDTNIVSEFMGAAPNPNVAAWLRAQQTSELALAAITVGEIRYGLALLPAGRRRASLALAFDRFVAEIIGHRVEPFDGAAAETFGAVMAARHRSGRTLDVSDLLIAATALTRGHIVATRNTADFEGSGVTLINPFTYDA
ncbi:MAG: type II toxin-antitoxin system VapC family toxin [Hyphomonas sp.]